MTRGRLWLLLASFAMRALAPAGYMPAPLAEGLPFVLCPDGASAAAAFIAGADGRHHHHGDGADRSPAWELCPFGAASAGAAPGRADDPAALSLVREPPAAKPPEIVRSAALRSSCRPRAPPTASSRDA